MKLPGCLTQSTLKLLAGLGAMVFSMGTARAHRVELTLPAPEKGTLGWYEATVVNESASPVTVTEVRFDMPSDPKWTLDTSSAAPSSTWADSANDIVWTGSQVVGAWAGFTFKVQAKHDLGSYTSLTMKVTATVDASPVDSQNWDASFLEDMDGSLELAWDYPDQGSHDSRDGDIAYVETDSNGLTIAQNNPFTFRIHVWEYKNKATKTIGTTELSVAIPAGSGWTGVTAAGAGVNFEAAIVSGSEATGWSLTWDLSTQLQDVDGEALFSATSPTGLSAVSLVPFEAVFNGLTDKNDDPNLISELTIRTAYHDGVLSVSSSGGPSAANVAPGSEIVVERLSFGATLGDVLFTSIDLTLQGSHAASDLSQVRLYTDDDQDGSSSGERLVGTFVVAGSHPNYELTSLLEIIASGDTQDYLIVIGVSGSATLGATLSTTLSDSDLTMGEGSSVNTFEVNSSTFTVSDWWDCAWTARTKLTFDNSAQTEDLDDFPLLVVLNGTRIDHAATQDAGEDIRFLDPETGAVLPHEVEVWDEGSDSFVWVKVPRVDGASTSDYIWMYYGNASAIYEQSTADEQAVWSNGHSLVWHMAETSGTTLADSTSNANTGTKASSTTPNPATGIIHGAQEFDNDASQVTNAGLSSASSLSVEAWVYTQTVPNAYNTIANWGDDAPWFGIESNRKLSVWRGGDNPLSVTLIPLNSWTHVAYTHDGTTARLYIDGNLDVTVGATDLKVAADLTVGSWGGGAELDGLIDEFRISVGVVRSTDWIGAQYLSMNDSFLTYGAEEQSECRSRRVIRF